MKSLRVALLAVALVTPSMAQAWQQSEGSASASSQGRGQERRGWFGVSLTCSECYVQRGGRVAYSQAPAISSVESGSPAHQAGLRNGDTIIAVEGQLVTTPEGFERFAYARAGVPIRLTVRKAGEQQREVTVTPAARGSASTMQEFVEERIRIAQRRNWQRLREGFRSPLGWLGLQLECEQCSVSSGRRLSSNFRQWPAVIMVDVDGPAHRGGIRRGDTLTAIDGMDLATREGGRAFASIEPEQRVTVTLRRGGREQRLPLIAVARPDATSEELSNFTEYKRVRDSADAEYRQVLSAHVQRANVELRELDAMLRSMETTRISADSSRRRLATIDSILRSLRRAENERARLAGESGLFSTPFAYAFPSVAPTPMPAPGAEPAQPIPPYAPAAALPPGAPRPVYPLRYSNRIGNVNIEARAPGAISASEVGDSLVVLYLNGMEIKIIRRADGRR